MIAAPFLHTSYAPALVLLSIAIATLASYVALDMAGRTAVARGHTRRLWLAAGSTAMGIGIWSMHFVGMLAFSLRATDRGLALPIAYDAPLMIASIVVAIGASALAIGVVSERGVSLRRMAGAGLLMGVAIAGMHYLGMASMRMPAMIGYHPGLFTASVVIAVVASYAALWLAQRLGNVVTRAERIAKFVAAGVMGLAITGMHFTGMAAAHFTAAPPHLAHGVGGVIASTQLAGTIAVGSVLVLIVALLGAAMDRGHHAQLDETARVGETRFLAVATVATDAIVTSDAAGHIVFWNDAATRLFGWTEAEALGTSLDALVPPSNDYASGDTIEAEGIRRDGTRFPIELSLSRWDADGQAFETRIIRDITARRVQEAEMRDSERRYRQVVELSPECIIVHADGAVLFANPAAATLLNVPRADALIGRRITEIVSAESRRDLFARMQHLVRVGDTSEPREYHITDMTGRALEVEVSSVCVLHDGRIAVQSHVRDVTPRKALERQLAHQAFHDPLTGLANRLLFRDRVEHAISLAARGGARPVVLFLDLDNFKRVNDAWGHRTGDQLLVEVASRLVATLRASDTCARLGGDEFAVLLDDPASVPATMRTRAIHVAERIVATLQQPIDCDGVDVKVGASVGIASAELGESADDVLRNADLAMYRAKHDGKGRFDVFEPAMHAAVRDRLELEGDLRHAVERGCEDLVVHYQPIASIRDGRITGFEALVRWRDAKRGIVSPLAFIPIAEESGLIVPIGAHVLRTACRQAQLWQRLTRTALSITVNLSPRQLVEPDLPTVVAAALGESGLAPEQLVLEMTESILIDDGDSTQLRLRALKALGVRLAIDDFGTGFSSLGYLERFPVDLLKIDKSFVDRVGAEHEESPLARAILGLGDALGMSVVAEGIETEAQWTRLRELGCEFGQGFYFAHPQPAAEVDALLVAQRVAA